MFSVELEMKLTSDIFKINILAFEYNHIYKGYIKKLKWEYEENNLYHPILFLKYSEISKIGHSYLINIKELSNINNYIKDISILINKRYNYHYLRKINLNNFNITKNNNNNKMKIFQQIITIIII